MNTDGGQAFPRPFNVNLNPLSVAHGEIACSDGMMLRDWFAGQALAGIAHVSAGYTVEGAAQRAYQLADAMLAERNK